MPSYTVAIFFTCPECGHNNKAHKKVRDSIILWIKDQLPPCKKCGAELHKKDFDFLDEYPPRLRRMISDLQKTFAQ